MDEDKESFYDLFKDWMKESYHHRSANILVFKNLRIFRLVDFWTAGSEGVGSVYNLFEFWKCFAFRKRYKSVTHDVIFFYIWVYIFKIWIAFIIFNLELSSRISHSRMILFLYVLFVFAQNSTYLRNSFWSVCKELRDEHVWKFS